MINSLNSLEFLKPKLITMDKFNCPATTKLLPPSTTLTQTTRTFVKISGNHHHQLHHQLHQHHHYNNTNDSQKQKPEFLLNNEIKQQQQQERVKVQHVENHTKLQNNNCWNNFRTFNYTSASSCNAASSGVNELKDDQEHEIDVVNVNERLTTPINIQNKSAFNLDLNNKKYLNINNNNTSICGNKNFIPLNLYNSRILEVNKNYKPSNTTTATMTNATETLTTITPSAATAQRTEDQNNAYRHIESVHNYAKSKSYEDDDDDNQSPNGSRHSSYLDDDEDDEEDEDDDDDEEYNDDNDADYDHDEDIDYEERLDDLDVDYEHIFNRRRQRRFQKLSTSSDGALLTKSYKLNNYKNVVAMEELRRKSAQLLKDQQILTLNVNKSNISNQNNNGEEEEIHVDVDVETVESQTSPNMQVNLINSSSTLNGIISTDEFAATNIKPDHHARRPMNAFLIFCKRHRAIVKERYKNLENRAITKILGDWWASLDANDKKCFTNLAQQNKDAFFSANPNFKWYKLPAPPLRTLTTRPANAFGQEYQEENDINAQEIISNNTRSCTGNSNYFKLADEAQMGDLSQLMQDKSKNTKQNADLQQALGETSQYMSAHITGNAEVLLQEENHLKRRFHNENSFSSNSSEDDMLGLEPKKKSARSCKGKRYQELINSGQIATAVKKTKTNSIRLQNGNGGGADNNEGGNVKQIYTNVNSFNNKLNVCQKRSFSECDNLLNYDLNSFDLEERIKELPALNLDDYLQRKRNTKKKKKFTTNGKKRGQRSSANNNNNSLNNIEGNLSKQILLNKVTLPQKLIAKLQNAAIPPTAVVGSQKRKARKESITRRDISAIEQEVASLLPLTINGCCYLQAIEKDTETTTTPATATQTLNNSTTKPTSPIIPLQQNTTTSSVSIDIFNNNNINNNNNTLNDNISSSTSDLLILAEVAANRTEL